MEAAERAAWLDLCRCFLSYASGLRLVRVAGRPRANRSRLPRYADHRTHYGLIWFNQNGFMMVMAMSENSWQVAGRKRNANDTTTINNGKPSPNPAIIVTADDRCIQPSENP